MNVELNIVMQKLTDSTLNMSVAQIVSEVSLLIERLNFAGIDPVNDDYKKKLERVEYLINRDVSPGMVRFVEFLIAADKIGVLLSDAGKLFPDYCKAYFSEMKQLTFTTPIELTDSSKLHARMMLMKIYPVNTRVIFDVNPELIAGFTLHDNQALITNRSMGANMAHLLRTYITKHVAVQEPWTKQTA